MRTRVIIGAAVATLMVTACTGDTDKSGGEITPTTLTLASNDGTQTGGGLAQFVALVDEKSDGRLRIGVSGEWLAEGEETVLQDVAGGKAALGWSGTRAFDLIGVNTFQPLHAPFLIGSYPAQQAVVGDEVAQDMMAGLAETGLVGLALLADELRLPVGAGGPLLDDRDFHGIRFGVMPSDVQTKAITALGAQPSPLSNLQTIGLEGLEGAETMWQTYVQNGQQKSFPFVTANAALWPRTTLVVANGEALDGLTDADREALTAAATEASLWSLEHADDKVAGEIARACQEGARIATASPDQVAALARATRPVYDALRAVPEQASILARVEELVDGADRPEAVEVPEGCAYRPGDEDHLGVWVPPEPLAGPGETGRLPEGTYRYSLTGDEIRSAVDAADPGYVSANAGVWTWTLDDGRWSYVLKATSQTADANHGGFTCDGYYDVHGDQVEFTTLTVPTSGECAPPTWEAVWRSVGDDLALDVTADGDDLQFLFGGKTWERID